MSATTWVHGLYYCRFCPEGFYDEATRDAHQLTCRPWERVGGSERAADPRFAAAYAERFVR